MIMCDDIRELIEELRGIGGMLSTAAHKATPEGEAHAAIAQCLGKLTEIAYFYDHVGIR